MPLEENSAALAVGRNPFQSGKVQQQRCQGDAGAALVDYALLVTLIALVCFAAITFVGGETCSKIDYAANSINAAVNNEGAEDRCP